jgi:hypothetical protein
VIAAAGVAALLVGTSQLAVAQTPAAPASAKQLMGANFGVLQTILYALIKGDYRAIPGQVDVIASHEEQLKKMAGDYTDTGLEQFLAYAANMGAHARDLKSISETLMQHDAKRPTPGYDHLREALAAHYGGMVQMCVSCHNRFRPEAAEAE